MMATLLVRGSAPPMPSIWRGSGEPMTASRTRSRNAISLGRSFARKKGPFEVPPRIRVQGMRVCDAGAMLITPSQHLSLILETHLRDFCAQAVDVESEFSPRQALASCLFLAKALFARHDYFVGGCSLHHHDAIVIRDDHVAGFDACSGANDAHIHRSESRFH